MKLIKLYPSNSYLEKEKNLTTYTPYGKSLSTLLINNAIQKKEFGASYVLEYPDKTRQLDDCNR
ncbi:hypothetical protein [Vibrio cholerae]|uniref:hypothetical protein n=1 Tax=Vibrio cholerae TaxID=666 RepID=UPI000A90163E|nr:hypothetical protein [Vibrio cholerae]EHY0934118.1 hypothetical protein [Vibrio cholerae]EJL6596220.1 hypothetical protein [Vibrio cholerae]EJL6615126.1 hypothetical protein [Vibrio cholerae]EKF9831425.1 hypothetical protein [Vibrio cholerae]MBJ6888556.1 hypothetical protein [Vibrio cholerae]